MDFDDFLFLYKSKVLAEDNMEFPAKHKLHSSQFHPTLRKLNEPNVDITPTNLMYPVFLM